MKTTSDRTTYSYVHFNLQVFPSLHLPAPISFFIHTHTHTHLITELKKAQTDLSAMKKQAESTSTEYDRLAEEHQKLQVLHTPTCGVVAAFVRTTLRWRRQHCSSCACTYGRFSLLPYSAKFSRFSRILLEPQKIKLREMFRKTGTTIRNR